MEKQENRSHPPCRWGYRGAMAVIRPMLRWVFHMRVENQATQGFEGPAVLVMNHQGLLDFLLAAAAFPQREISYVGFKTRGWPACCVGWASFPSSNSTPMPARSKTSCGASKRAAWWGSSLRGRPR